MTVCEACTAFCQPMISKGYGGIDPDKPLIAHPECSGWISCNCACQAATRLRERAKMHSRAGGQPRAEPELPEPMF